MTRPCMTQPCTTQPCTTQPCTTHDRGDAVTQALTSVVDLGSRLARSITGLAASVRSSVACTCERPRACWLPNELAPLDSVVDHCGTARVCFRVRNSGLADRHVFVAATGPDAGLVLGHPSTAVIGALQTRELVAELTLPQGSECAEVILWVRGCQDTAVSWTVTASTRGCATSHHQVAVVDGPGTRHEWYAHFDQPQPCGAHANG